ncbi:MAG TPA: dienelactone hydrolase family protein [Candidatus Angelobacter sp.]|nr:dienelactone hydrolase family protein [Candidatus Angelobacter sp.]
MQPQDGTRRSEVVVYHSAYGLRPAIIDFADKLRAAGHSVHTPDLYDGEVFSDRNDAIRKIQELGFDKLLDRAVMAVEALPHDLVYAGFSNGGVCAELLAATRPGARGAILIHAPLMVRDLGWTVWPSNVPVQVHFADKDPIRNQAVIDALCMKVRQSGSAFEQFEYDAPGHLFADPAFPAYNSNAAELMTTRVLEFLRRDGLTICDKSMNANAI